MEILFAPMEGITHPEFRRVNNSFFPGADAYFAPFIAPSASSNFKPGFLEKKLPDREYGINLIPQLLANRADCFTETAEKLEALGFEEVNLNAGCPSGTVFSKHKGSGMLADPDSLDAFLEGIFSSLNMKISVKTRLGAESADEFPKLLEIYNRYPISKLVIHARDRKGMYASKPDEEMFAWAFRESKNPVCYNGDIVSKESLEKLEKTVPGLDSIMVGRGALRNPALIRVLRGGKDIGEEEFFLYHDALIREYLESGLSPFYTLERMKELWDYMKDLFPEEGKTVKQIKKAKSIEEYRAAVSCLNWSL